MDKLHSKVEEVKNEPDLAAKIIQTLRSFAVKTEKLKTARVESAAEICLEVLNASLELDENIQLGSTPKREVGKGGSVVGRQNMKVSYLPRYQNNWLSFFSHHNTSSWPHRDEQPKFVW